ncbi:hypothetical protein EGW08_021899 [Elysia chlorotica]|uniref:Peptidase S1 domain-containing protein n=1 Tax=Elysia chlorotica TaxID=188477 RepID=A0A3S1AWT9_ELYCH|nr:hypothetical protein EGW08_021899 [Elysia chlorotica]
MSNATSETGEASSSMEQRCVDLVWEKKHDQGCHECEVIGGSSEAEESDQAWTKCTKNPGHYKFLPASKFALKHLDRGFRCTMVFNSIKAISDLTVRLRVTYTSLNRPNGYAFAKYKGSHILHLGSGWVYRVRLGEGPCPCRDCTISSASSTQWYRIYIFTACHVVYNSEEAQHTMVDFFYDDETFRKTGKMSTIWGSEVVVKDEDKDYSLLSCAIHSNDLFMKLKEARQNLSLRELVRRALRNSQSLPKPAVVIVSHPHGQAKQITVGRLVRMKFDAEPREQVSDKCLVYTTDTCPGSSGAPVIVIGSRTMFSGFVSHSGCKQVEKVNYSGEIVVSKLETS